MICRGNLTLSVTSDHTAVRKVFAIKSLNKSASGRGERVTRNFKLPAPEPAPAGTGAGSSKKFNRRAPNGYPKNVRLPLKFCNIFLGWILVLAQKFLK